ncbi:MAG: FAD-binding protein, partial [Flavisolibacter sp.]
MQQQLILKLLPSEAASGELIKTHISQLLSVPAESVSGYNIIKQSIDARSKQVSLLTTVIAFINEPFHPRNIRKIILRDVSQAKHEVIV